MGNAPSKEAQAPAPARVPHKLSKPRVGNYATAGLLSSNASLNIPSYSRAGLVPASPSPTAPPPSENGNDPGHDFERRLSVGPPRPKSSRRRSLFRSKSSQGSSDRRASRRNTVIGAPFLAPGGDTIDIARSNSMISDLGSNSYYEPPVSENWPPAGCRSSWTYDLTSYEAQRLLNLVQDLPPQYARRDSAAPETRVQEMISEVTWKSSHPPQPPSSPISRANSEMSLHPPVRRRSIIQTPGVATRMRPNTGPSRPSFRHSHPSTPSLSRQASFESDGSRVLSMPPLPPPNRDFRDVPRAVTPTDGEYRAIGGFKLGSLRITNGSPVLTPENAKFDEVGYRKSRPLLIKEGTDYFSTKKPRANGLDDELGKIIQHQAPQDKVTPGFDSKISGTVTPALESVSNVTASLQQVTTAATKVQRQCTSEVHHSTTDAEPKSPIRQALQTTSKHTAVEDHLFEVEDLSEPEISSAIEVLDVRLDPNAKTLPPLLAADATQRKSRGMTRTDSGFISMSHSASESSKSSKSLDKADSGYSSNVSLRSFQNGKRPMGSGQDEPRTSSESSRNLPKVALQDSSATLSGFLDAQKGDEKPPPLPPKDEVSVAVSTQTKTGARNNNLPSNLQRAHSIPRKPVGRHASPVDSVQPTERNIRTPDSVPDTPASAKSDSSASSLSIGTAQQKPGKLQRLLSLRSSTFSKTPLTVHVTHMLDNDVPSIPVDVGSKFSERSGLFPITTKRLALRTQLSKDTLKTILSVGSLEVAKDGDQISTLTSTEEEQKQVSELRDKSLKQALYSVQSTVRQAATSVIPTRKPISRKPVPTRHRSQLVQSSKTTARSGHSESDSILQVEAEVTTYSFVNGSLGNNAYDSAAQAMTDNQALYFSPTGRDAGRAMSMSGIENRLGMRTNSVAGSPIEDDSNLLFPRPFSPIDRPPSPSKKEKGPPPVSMRMRRSLRVPAPIRPELADPTLTRQKSRESYPALRGLKGGIPEQPSREELATAPTIPPLDPRRRQSHSASGSQYRSPNWDPQANHGSMSARRSTGDHSRHNSFSSVQSEHIRSPNSQVHGQQQPNVRPLKHRSSYDGSGRDPTCGGFFPHPAHRGPGPAPRPQFDPWNNPHFNLQEHQWDQPGRYPPYFPRGNHYRNRSMSGRPGQYVNPPYRVLHSYNSPAYRNVPIWG